MYPTLESRIFHSYLLQAVPVFAPCPDSLLGEDAWLSLYRWTQDAYRYFSAHPESIVKETHEDDGYLRGMRTIDKPKLKPNMRRSLQAMNGLLETVWDFVSIGDVNADALLLPALKLQPVAFRLFPQRVRDVLADFENIDPMLQKFILDNHARCNGCGHCTQRSKGRQRPYTIHVNFEDHIHALCPINYVYTYYWPQLDDDLASCIIAFLCYLEAKFMP